MYFMRMQIVVVEKCNLRGVPGSTTNVKNSWIHFQKDGYNSSLTYEWLITRYGVYSTSSSDVHARGVPSDGAVGARNSLNCSEGARPTFYLSSKAKIAKGEGTKENPFVLSV